mgnify:FL=1
MNEDLNADFWQSEFYELNPDAQSWIHLDGDNYIIMMASYNAWHLKPEDMSIICVPAEELHTAITEYYQEKNDVIKRYQHNCGVGGITWDKHPSGEEVALERDDGTQLIVPIVKFGCIQMEHG